MRIAAAKAELIENDSLEYVVRVVNLLPSANTTFLFSRESSLLFHQSRIDAQGRNDSLEPKLLYLHPQSPDRVILHLFEERVVIGGIWKDMLSD